MYQSPLLDVDLSITNGIVSSKIYDKWGEFEFEIVNFLFSRKVFLAPCISQLMRFAILVLLDFSLTVKAAPHECVIRTSQP